MSRHVAAQVLWDYFHISPSSLQVFDTSEIFKYGVLGLFIRLSAPVASNGQVSSQRAEKKKKPRGKFHRLKVSQEKVILAWVLLRRQLCHLCFS